MSGVVERAPHRSDIRGNTGRGFVVGEQHRLDGMALIGSERFLVPLDRRAFTPLRLDYFDLKAEPLGHVYPEVTEHPEARGENLVAGDSVFDSAASHAPVPLEGKMKAWPELVLKIFFRFSSTGAARSGKSDDLWSSMALCMARRTRSGTLVGPGTKRKLRPAIWGPRLFEEGD